MRLVVEAVRWLLSWFGSPRGRGLHVRYAPAIDGQADPGEVVWTWVPFEDDPRRGKDRPVVVIGLRDGRRVGLALTTQRSGRPEEFELGRGPWDRGQAVSYAKLDRLIDLEARPIRREGAVLPRDRFDAVIAAYERYERRE